MKIISFIIQSFFVLLMIGVAGIFLVPMLPIDHNIELRIVQSGSMEPAIMTGALIIVQPQDTYAVGDVVMFSSRHAKVPTTHRIVETYDERGQTWFVTKGDANEEADAEAVLSRDVVGVVQYDVPRVGYILDFARQPVGFAFLIVLPAVLIILSEIEKIWRELRRKRKPSKDDEADGATGDKKITEDKSVSVPVAVRQRRLMMDIARPIRYVDDIVVAHPTVTSQPAPRRRSLRWFGATVTVVLVTLVAAPHFWGPTVSYFHDSEETTGNAFTAIALDFIAEPDGQTYNFAAGGVVGDDGVLVTLSPEGESVPMYYDVSTAVVGELTPLCAVLLADAASPLVYGGSLLGLGGNGIDFAAPWAIIFSLSNDTDLLGGETCDIELTFLAWHYDAASGEGYYDEEVVPIHFNFLPSVSLQIVSPAAMSLGALSLDEAPDTGEDEEGGVEAEIVKSSGGGGTHNDTEPQTVEAEAEETESAGGETKDGSSGALPAESTEKIVEDEAGSEPENIKEEADTQEEPENEESAAAEAVTEDPEEVGDNEESEEVAQAEEEETEEEQDTKPAQEPASTEPAEVPQEPEAPVEEPKELDVPETGNEEEVVE